MTEEEFGALVVRSGMPLDGATRTELYHAFLKLEEMCGLLGSSPRAAEPSLIFRPETRA